MGLVRAKKTVFLNEYGYQLEGTEFEYNGPDNENLVAIDKDPKDAYQPHALIPEAPPQDHVVVPGKWDNVSTDDLKAELDKRKVKYKVSASDDELRAALTADDGK